MPKLDFAGSVYPLIFSSVAISALAQIALKAGMASPSVQRAIHGGGSRAGLVMEIIFNPFVAVGLFFYASSAAVWLLVLARVQVSFAYPFVALGFVLTALLGRMAFHDTFSTGKIIGTMLIFAGVIVMGRSA